MLALVTEAVPVLGGIFGVSPRFAGQSTAVCGARGVSASLVDTIAGLESIAGQWQALERGPGSRATPFQSYAFHREWVRHFADEAAGFRVVVVRENGRIVLIWPLALRKTPLGPIAGWMGDPLIQYGDVVCAADKDPAPWLDAAFAALAARGDVAAVTLANVRADAAIAGWAGANMKATGGAQYAVAIDLAGFREPGDFARARSSRAARNRKREKKLAALGDVAFRVLEGGEMAASRVADAVEMKTAWFREHGLMGRAFNDPRFAACLEGLARRSADAGVVVSTLDVGTEPAAIEIGFRLNERYCAFLGAFAGKFARLSPGQVQMQKTVEWNIEQGAAVYDLMAPADTYKRELGTLETQTRSYCRAMRPAGIPAAIWSAFGPRALKAAFNLLPRGLRATIRNRLS